MDDRRALVTDHVQSVTSDIPQLMYKNTGFYPQKVTFLINLC